MNFLDDFFLAREFFFLFSFENSSPIPNIVA